MYDYICIYKDSKGRTITKYYKGYTLYDVTSKAPNVTNVTYPGDNEASLFTMVSVRADD